MTNRGERGAVISGVGQSQVGRRIYRDPLDLTIEGTFAALESAGLDLEREAPPATLRQDAEGVGVNATLPSLGPDAVAAATEAFEELGATVLVRPTPWRLGPAQAAQVRTRPFVPS